MDSIAAKIDAPIYIYTVPKAGTYLLGALLEELGYKNTGWHIANNSYLDTHSFDDVTNREFPSKTKVEKFYIKTFREIQNNQFAFGHLNPSQLPNQLYHTFHFISSYRHPREVLQSEFIDFRYRRKDVRFVSEAAIFDRVTAFEAYMQEHAPIIRNIFINFLIFQDRYRTPLNRVIFGEKNLCINFRDLINNNPPESFVRELARFFQHSPEQILNILRRAQQRDNKTKSTELKLSFNKKELWSEKAESLYRELNFPEIEVELLEKLIYAN
jgi:hypothetical protein